MANPTIRQQKVVELALSDKIRTKGELLAKAGYSEATCKRPSQVLGSEGVQKLIATADNIEGLDDTSVLLVVKKAIQDRDYKQGAQTALKWLQLKYNTKANFTDNRQVNVQGITDMSKVDEQAHIYMAKKYNISITELKKRLSK